MFRHSLRRCATHASTVATASLLRSRTALPISRQGLSSIPSRFVSPLRNVPLAVRAYSADAAAQQQTEPAQNDVVAFGDLQSRGVSPQLIRAITQDLKYENMTPVQAKTINPALKGTDIVAQAKTGTGKTIAFLLPLLQRMINDDPQLATRGARRTAASDDIRGIVLSPTRELAEQIAAEARQLVRHTGITVQTAVGGTHKASALRRMQNEGCHLLVGTPGRLNDLLHDTHAHVAAPNLASLVLDEADRMLDVGFERELNEIIGALPRPEQKIRQTVLVSATIPDNVIRLARSMVRQDDFEFVQTIAENDSLTHEKIPQHMVRVSSWANMFPTLLELVERETDKARQEPGALPFKAIVYFNTSATVDFATAIFRNLKRTRGIDIPVYSIQGKRTQQQRQSAADNFRESKSAILLSSDVTARGMDFPNVTHVIQIDVPRDRETYIHRLGRTGRQDKSGQGWLFLPPLSISPARRSLEGLPIQKNSSLECAEADASTATSASHQKLEKIYPELDEELFTQTYCTLISASTHGKRELAEDLNEWATGSCGMSKPPGVSTMFVRKQNLSPSSFNIIERRYGSEDRYGGGGDSGRSRYGGGDPGRSRYGAGRSGDNEDGFANMRRNIRRDEPRSGGGFQRGSRGGRGPREPRDSQW
ncbi:hypothetical protein S40288_06212 [Stachybotrys chartarum IBT 40288]|nr:hypothetical protein S40288_06212 [Stachybotrys chartarum IBT 40288]